MARPERPSHRTSMSIVFGRASPTEWSAHCMETDRHFVAPTPREVMRQVCLHIEAETGTQPPREGRR